MSLQNRQRFIAFLPCTAPQTRMSGARNESISRNSVRTGYPTFFYVHALWRSCQEEIFGFDDSDPLAVNGCLSRKKLFQDIFKLDRLT
jgi:hypothetical protein